VVLQWRFIWLYPLRLKLTARCVGKMGESLTVETLLKRDRAVVLLGLAGITVLSWLYLLHLNRSMAMSMDMANMPDMSMPMMQQWRATDFLLTFVMWSVMMVGMMVPSVAPMVLTFATVNRRRAERGGPYVPTGIFLAGYLVAWTIFSLIATLAEWRLHAASLLNSDTQTLAPRLAAGILVAAGIFQLTPFKNACLTQCRSPLDFLTTEWREGWGGALRMGLKHGVFCVGCCWMLMALLFVAGVMNLLWVAAIAAFVLAEKLLPRGRLISFAGAAVCLVAGLVWLSRTLRAG
jgi:predicted metal-binding membrane protein